MSRSLFQKEVIDCCETGDLEGLKHISNLSEFGLDFIDDDGFNPLLTAVHNHQNHIVQYLLSRDGFVPGKNNNRYKTTGLHVAAYRHNYGALRLLLDKYEATNTADLVNAQDKWGKTPLHHAVYHGFDAGVQELMRFNGTDKNIRDKLDKTPLEYSLF